MDHGTVALRLLRIVSDRLVELGCDARALHERMGTLDGNPFRRAPFDDLADLVELGLELTGDRDLGLRLRGELDARRGGVLVLLMLACPDVRAALRRLERYQRIGFDAHRVTFDPDGAVAVTFPGPERPALRHLREWFFADGLAAVRSLTGAPAKPIEVTFSHPAPPTAEAVERFFGCPVRFGAPRSILRWSDEVLARPLLNANEVFLAAFEEQAGEMLAALPIGPRWTERVRAVIIEALPDVDVVRVAVALRVTPRTLQRRLRAEGSSVAHVLADVRRELSARYLAEGRDVAEVSYLLGYSSPTSFHRAFCAWYDTTPGAYREQSRSRR